MIWQRKLLPLKIPHLHQQALKMRRNLYCDTVHCWYTGTLEDGTVFDSNTGAGKTKKPKHPLSFKVGVGRVIRGWDEALLTMSKGEKSKITIEPEWAYGKKGLPSAGVPPNSRLIFEVIRLLI
ncbi:FK506-binding protein 2B, variant 2 [Entomophthora muscae]|uniref:FK506-binding protein 2B, variant 2 n=1 Tax=Entomophthora muscae TaxID=34485 RepID=A0ACC2TAB3_9FUNG|nr:FK506-binding protein 2B, variant 2 [Entomophthora muscae]